MQQQQVVVQGGGAVNVQVVQQNPNPKTPVEDWVTGRGYAHMALFFFNVLGFIFFIVYLAGISQFTASMVAVGLPPPGSWMWIPPFTCWALFVASLILSRNETTGCVFMCLVPFIHFANLLWLVAVWFVAAVLSLLVNPETCLYSYYIQSEIDGCLGFARAFKNMQIGCALLMIMAAIMCITSWVRGCEIKKTVVVVTPVQTQPVMMAVPMQQMQPVYAQQGTSPQSTNPQSFDHESGLPVAEPAANAAGVVADVKSIHWGLDDLNPFKPAKFDCVRRA